MRDGFSLCLKEPIFEGISIVCVISFHILAPDLVIKLSANLVLTRGIRNWLEVLVGYRWKVLFSENRLSKVRGSRDFEYLNMKMPADKVKISGSLSRLNFLQKAKELPRFLIFAISLITIFCSLYSGHRVVAGELPQVRTQ